MDNLLYFECRARRRALYLKGWYIGHWPKRTRRTDHLESLLYVQAYFTVFLEFDYYLFTYCTVDNLFTVAAVHFGVDLVVFDHFKRISDGG